jgi:hypothetical protein
MDMPEEDDDAGEDIDNVWLSHSELAISGRPRATPIVQLPTQRQIIVPESVNPDADCRTSDRPRPSPLQVAAQKGAETWASLIKSAMTDMPWTQQSVLLICNLTPYVEDVGLAIVDMRLGSAAVCNLPSERLFYMSIHTDQSVYEYGLMRLENTLIDAWMEKRLLVPGAEFSDTLPELTDAELQQIPGAAAASGQLDKLKLTITERAPP